MADIDAFLGKAVNAFKAVLKENLTGIYLHGSLAMGCYNPERSDIDLILVAKEKLSGEEVLSITRQVLLLHEDSPGGTGMELSIILESYVLDFVYPTPFEYHYSEHHRERYQADPGYLCGGIDDPDLAAHLTVIYHRGLTLWGVPVQELFQPIESRYYIQSILQDVSEAAAEITGSPVYYALNLCRVLFYLREGAVSSKKEGGEWGLKALPDKYHFIIRTCLDEYSGNGLGNPQRLDDEQLVEFAEYMLGEIDRAMKKV
ncbi:DUF4111 domain-containing protein [Paenibacillus glycanilyticus]|nr:DUF4111 domain-containing protein [Paenibacillus glycanilyticus]